MDFKYHPLAIISWILNTLTKGGVQRSGGEP